MLDMRKFTSVTYIENGSQELSWRLAMFQTFLTCTGVREGILDGRTDLSIFPKLYGLKVTLEIDGRLIVEGV
jgi:hypothetical protein